MNDGNKVVMSYNTFRKNFAELLLAVKFKHY